MQMMRDEALLPSRIGQLNCYGVGKNVDGEVLVRYAKYNL